MRGRPGPERLRVCKPHKDASGVAHLPTDFDAILAPLVNLAGSRRVDGGYLGVVTPPGGFVQTAKFNFGRYAETETYKRANDDLLDVVLGLLPQRSITVVDVATGHGMIPRLVAAKIANINMEAHIIGVDLDVYAVEQAKTQIRDTKETHFTFLQGDARNLSGLLAELGMVGRVDYTDIHGALHEIRDDQDKVNIVGSQAGILRPGGLWSYNSGFTTVAATMEYGIWLVEFMKLLEAKRYKGDDVKRMPVHPPQFYRNIATGRGLNVIYERIIDVPHDLEALEAISEYPPFIEGFTESVVFPRAVEMEEAVWGMKKAIPPVLQRIKKDSLPRKFHELIAQKAAW